jgi:hypothetical protein
VQFFRSFQLSAISSQLTDRRARIRPDSEILLLAKANQERLAGDLIGIKQMLMSLVQKLTAQ